MSHLLVVVVAGFLSRDVVREYDRLVAVVVVESVTQTPGGD